MLRVAALVSGGGTNLQAIIDKIDCGYIKNAEIVTVISNRKKAYALERAKLNNIEGKLLRPMDFDDKEAFSQAMIAYIDSLDVDLIVLAGYLVILPNSFIAHYRNKIVNIHPSLIPAFSGHGFYGLKVHEAALERGVKMAGATAHFVDEGTDTGPIIMQKCVAVHDGDTPEVLQRRVMEEAEWTIYPEAIKLIAEGRVTIDGHKVKIG